MYTYVFMYIYVYLQICMCSVLYTYNIYSPSGSSGPSGTSGGERHARGVRTEALASEVYAAAIDQGIPSAICVAIDYGGALGAGFLLKGTWIGRRGRGR